MKNLKEFKTRYPQYKDWPDDHLAREIHKKFYSSGPLAGFVACLGLGVCGFGVEWPMGISAVVAIISGLIWWLWEANKHPYLGGC